MLSRKKVVLGLSGGVDSSVAAALLLEQGFEVIGVFMKNWHDTSVTISDDCPWLDDSHDALLVAEKLGIPFHVLDFSVEYKERIVDYMFKEYESGRTPNPDILCNREIKFDLFLKAAQQLGAHFVGTGHYCRKVTDANGGHHLLSGVDTTKDQSYFLCQLSQAQLAVSLFPIGSMTKKKVREKATSLGLVTAEKKDSQGLCFIGKVKLPVFLQQQLKPKKGHIIEVSATREMYAKYCAIPMEKTEELAKPFAYSPEDGKIIGSHDGAHFFTVGQRKGLRVGGHPLPLFVIGTDVVKNIIYVGQGNDHPGLLRKALFIENKNAHWIRPDLMLEDGKRRSYLAKIRYRQKLQIVELRKCPEGLYLVFDEWIKGITPGQFAAWYDGEELIGSGPIEC